MAVIPGAFPGAGSFHLRFTPLGWQLAGFWFALWAVGWVLFILPESWLPFLYFTTPLPGGGTTTTPLWAHLWFVMPNGAAAGTTGFEPWQVVTGPLLYPPAGLGSFVLAALGLGFFGGTVERFLGKRKFLELWVVSLLGAAGLGSLLGLVQQGTGPHYGFGAVVLALIVIHCLLTPEATVSFFLVLPVKMKWIAYAVIGIAVARTMGMFTPFGAGAGGGWHLGGILAGTLWWRYRDDIDPRRFARRRKAKGMLRAVENTITEVGDDGPVYH